MFTMRFLVGATERAIKTFAQALAAFLVANATGLLDVNWGQAFSVSGLALLMSVLTSLTTGTVTGPPSSAGDGNG